MSRYDFVREEIILDELHAAGRVTGFSVNQDRVWDLRFTRQP